MSEDEVKDLETQAQKMTDKFIKPLKKNPKRFLPYRNFWNTWGHSGIAVFPFFFHRDFWNFHGKFIESKT